MNSSSASRAGSKVMFRAQFQRTPAHFVDRPWRMPRYSCMMRASTRRAFENRKNIQCQTLIRKQLKKPRQLGHARMLMMPFVTMIVIVILRRRRQL